MKKIIYLSNSVIPSQYANSIHVMKMCQAFKFNNYCVDLLFYSPAEDISEEDIFTNYGVKHKFSLIPLSYRFIKGKFFQNFFKILLYLNNNSRTNIVYGRDIYGVFFAALMGFPVYFESHGTPVNSIQLFLEKLLYKNKNFKKLIVISDKLKEIYIDENFPIKHENIKVFHDGADLIDDDITHHDFGKGFHVGYIGSLYYHGRGIDIILEIAKDNPKISFHIIGGKEDEIKFWQERSSSNIKFYGFIPNNLITKYLLGLDVAVMPYQENLKLDGMDYNTIEWMSPMKMFEYMSAAKAIVTSDLPVIREVLNTKNSILVKSDDVAAWSNAVSSLYRNPDFLKDISQNAHDDFKSKYTWNMRAKYLVLEFIS